MTHDDDDVFHAYVSLTTQCDFACAGSKSHPVVAAAPQTIGANAAACRRVCGLFFKSLRIHPHPLIVHEGCTLVVLQCSS